MAKHKSNNIYLKNRSATHHYAIEDTLSAGIVLMGSEIKSIRASKVSFADSYCFFNDAGELFIKNLNIASYSNAGYADHLPTRERKLLLTKKELKKWQQKIKEKGMTIVPLSIYINEGGLAKMNIGIGKGKKLYDKRQSIKERDIDRAVKQQKW